MQREGIRTDFRRFVILSIVVITASPLWAQVPAESKRMTPLVKVIQEIEPAVIGLFVKGEENQYGSGSGTIIHPSGYVLTNNHVVGRTEGFAVFRNKAIRFVVVGRLPEKDLALLRLRDVTPPLPTLPLGHSHDVMNGESVVVSGNPGGRGIVFTAGIVSSKRVMLNAPNALVMTQFSNSRRDDFIQFDAASNRGNSGGPLVNMDGEVIGIVSALIPKEQNSNFAIPIDRVRELLERVLEPEVIYQKSVGVRLNPQADQALVTEVIAGSAAARAGLQSGDVIAEAFGGTVRHAADWTMALHHRLPSGKPVEVIVKRGAEQLLVKVIPDDKPPLEPVESKNVEPGLEFAFYHGRFNFLPDFTELESVRSGTVEELDLDEIRGDRDEEFAVSLRGLMKINSDGLYRLTITSDDGSRVYLHDETFIDNDGNHPPTPASRVLRAKAGLHPIRIEHYEATGEQSLEIKLERFDKDKDESSEVEFFYEKES